MNDFYDDHIELDYNIERKDKGIYEYRLSIFDANGHYQDEIYLGTTHLIELYHALKKMNLESMEEF